MKQITIWRVLTETSKNVYKFIHNHIEDGHVFTKKPIGKFKNQTVSWAAKTWEREPAFLNDSHIVVHRKSSIDDLTHDISCCLKEGR